MSDSSDEGLPDVLGGEGAVTGPHRMTNLDGEALFAPVEAAVVEAGGPELRVLRLLEDHGGLQAAFLLGSEQRWERLVAQIALARPVSGSEDGDLGRWMELERAAWAALGAGVPPQEGEGLLQSVPAGLPPKVWREHVRAMRVPWEGAALHGVLRPFLPWPSLAEQAVDTAELYGALAAVVDALRLSGPGAPSDWVDADVLLLDLLNPETSPGRLRPQKILLGVEEGSLRVVRPTSWLPWHREWRARAVWEREG